jgi:hypothetical protein
VCYVNSLIQPGGKELIKKCQDWMDVIVRAKEKQAQEANKYASLLLKELDQEKSREQNKKLAAQRKREKRKAKNFNPSPSKSRSSGPHPSRSHQPQPTSQKAGTREKRKKRPPLTRQLEPSNSNKLINDALSNILSTNFSQMNKPLTSPSRSTTRGMRSSSRARTRI